jgi:VanZ family protein
MWCTWQLRRVFLVITLFIVYGSLYPWNFHPALSNESPLFTLLHAWPEHFDRFLLKDIPINLLLYVPFGASAYLAFSRGRTGFFWAMLPVALAILVSGSIEMIQLFDDHRVCSAVDLLTNVIGAIAGVIAALVWMREAPRGIGWQAVDSGAALLLFCWAAALLFPFMPDLSRTHLREKLELFAAQPFSLSTYLAATTQWALAGRLLQAAWNRKGWWSAYLLLFFLFPARFFVLHSFPYWTQLAGVLTGILVWAVIARYRSRNRVLLGLLMLSIVVTGLTPLRWAPIAQRFEWLPFVSLLRGEWEAMVGVFLQKIFLYGAAVWLASGLAIRWWRAGLLIALPLSLIEYAQRYLPGHTPETTDPLLAILMAWLLHRVTKSTSDGSVTRA